MMPRSTESYRLPVPSGEIQVHRSYCDAAGDFAVVFVHGFGSTRKGEKARALEDACARRSWTFAAFDFRGHGDSTGRMLELKGSTLLEDLETLHADLATKGARRLYLVGSSMGGWTAAWFTIRHPGVVPACVVIAPAFDFIRNRWTRLSDDERAAWQRTGRHRVQNEWVDTEVGYALIEEIDHFPMERLAADWCTPLLIYHGTADEAVPHSHSVAFVERCAYPIELRLMEGGDHRLNTWKEEIMEGTCEFFAAQGAAA
jgi:uncharacterized protein